MTYVCVRLALLYTGGEKLPVANLSSLSTSAGRGRSMKVVIFNGKCCRMILI